MSAHAGQRQAIVKAFHDSAVDPNSKTGTAFWLQLRKETGLPAHMLKRVTCEKQQEKLRLWQQRRNDERNEDEMKE